MLQAIEIARLFAAPALARGAVEAFFAIGGKEDS
jgi:hypothetical protein